MKFGPITVKDKLGCDVAIALYQEYCGAGIVRIMMETVLEEARKYGGFPDNMKYADGTYTDAWWMMKKL
nr:hypothetical protein [Butyrivibrio sp. XBB1001]